MQNGSPQFTLSWALTLSQHFPGQRRRLFAVRWRWPKERAGLRSSSAESRHVSPRPGVCRLRAPHQQDDEDYQEDCPEPAADIRAAKVEAATTEQDQQNNDEDYQVHEARTP